MDLYWEIREMTNEDGLKSYDVLGHNIHRDEVVGRKGDETVTEVLFACSSEEDAVTLRETLNGREVHFSVVPLELNAI